MMNNNLVKDVITVESMARELGKTNLGCVKNPDDTECQNYYECHAGDGCMMCILEHYTPAEIRKKYAEMIKERTRK